jgi:fido (protein-threonine AMPylation protein)
MGIKRGASSSTLLSSGAAWVYARSSEGDPIFIEQILLAFIHNEIFGSIYSFMGGLFDILQGYWLTVIVGIATKRGESY